MQAFVRMSYHSAEIFVYEPSLYSTFPPNFIGQRIDMLYSCLLAAKSFYEVMLAQAPASYYAFAAPSLAQHGYACSTLMKLSLVEEVGWDLAQAWQTFNIAACLDQIISNFEQAGRAIDATQSVPCRESFPSGCARAMKNVKSFYMNRMVPVSEVEKPSSAMDRDILDTFNWNAAFDYLDDTSYWQEIWGDMNFMQQNELEHT
jgi:hypothetical protein